MADKDEKSIAKTGPKKPASPKKESRFHPVRFIREVMAELKKVSWPTRNELIGYTVVVLIFVLIMTTLVGVADFAMGSAFSYGIQIGKAAL